MSQTQQIQCLPRCQHPMCVPGKSWLLHLWSNWENQQKMAWVLGPCHHQRSRGETSHHGHLGSDTLVEARSHFSLCPLTRMLKSMNMYSKLTDSLKKKTSKKLHFIKWASGAATVKADYLMGDAVRENYYEKKGVMENASGCVSIQRTHSGKSQRKRKKQNKALENANSHFVFSHKTVSS